MAGMFEYLEVEAVDVKKILECYSVFEDSGTAYTYTFSGSVPFPTNSEAEFNAIGWTDLRTKPLWADVIGSMYNSWIFRQRLEPIRNVNLLAYQNGFLANALALKAASVHSHGTGDITGLVSALADKVNAMGVSNLAVAKVTGTSDSNGEVKFSLTNTGVGSGAALYSSVIVIPTGVANTSTDLNAPHAYIDRWEDSGKTVVIKATKAATQTIVIAATTDPVNFIGSGVTLEAIVIGVKV